MPGDRGPGTGDRGPGFIWTFSKCIFDGIGLIRTSLENILMFSSADERSAEQLKDFLESAATSGQIQHT